MGRSRGVVFEGPAGRLEGILQGADGAPARLAVVCHPLPIGGGTMHTKVVHRAARALEACGHLVLRFNFRGVGGSEGAFDRGAGERDDAFAALEWIAAGHPGIPVTMAGFSFGSWVGLRVGAADSRVDALVAIAPPVNMYDFSFLGLSAKPKLVIHGDADELIPLSELEAFYASAAEPKRLAIIPGGSHLLTGGLDRVDHALREFGLSLPGSHAAPDPDASGPTRGPGGA